MIDMSSKKHQKISKKIHIAVSVSQGGIRIAGQLTMWQLP